jgi:hypothetical protein
MALFYLLQGATVALAVAPPQAGASSCLASADEFAHLKNLKEKCNANKHARHDMLEVGDAKSESDSICRNIYARIKVKIKEYETFRSQRCSAIQRYVAEAKACSVQGGGSQKNCAVLAKKNYKNAATAEREIAAHLKKSTGEINELKSKAEEAISKYEHDKQEIEKALANSKTTEIYKTRIGTPEAIAEAQKIAQTRETASGVTGNLQLAPSPEYEISAENGKAPTIVAYKDKIDTLVKEQNSATQTADGFVNLAESQAQSHNARAAEWDRMAAASSSSGSNLSSHKDSAITGKNGPTANNTSGSSQMGSSAQSNGSGVGEGAGSGSGTGSSGSGGGMPQIASMGGGAAGGAQGTTAQPDSPDMDSVGSSNPAASTKLGGSGQSNKKDSKTAKGGAGSPEFAGVPESSNFGSGMEGSFASGSSSNSEKNFANSAKGSANTSARGVDSSGSSGSSAGDSERKPSSEKKSAQSLKDFEMNLNSGAVGIAGSEVASTFDDLSSEFGIGGEALTEEEKAVFASLEDLDKDGSATANASMIDGVGEKEGQPLFYRTKGAHERALKRGNLMVTVKTRL